MPDQLSDLNHSPSIVTGAAQGIGEAVAAALAAGGHPVALLDVNADGARSAAARLEREHSVPCVGLRCDVSDAGDVEAAVEAAAERLGAPRVLVNNAAIGRYRPLLDLTVEDFTASYRVNLIGQFLCARALVQRAQGRSCSIVNLASVAAHLGGPGAGAYAASKGAVVALTRVMAVELAPLHVRVNAVSPGPVDTPLTRQLSDDATTARRLSRVPLARMAAPTELGSVIAFLASEAASFVTGQTLCVDGGWTAQSL